MSNGNEKKFSNRAFVSVLTGFSFVVMALTGLVLFFAPSCRIARDTSWVVWGHNKDQWTGVHVWFSIAFVVASVFHLYLNWAALTNYFKTKLKRGLAFRLEWIFALVICGILYAGTVGEVAPFSSLMVWKETFKHGAAGEGQGQGWRGGRAQNLQGDNDQQSHSRQVQQQVGSCEEGQTQAHGPVAGRGGMGRQTLRQFCSDGGIELSWALSRLRNEGFTARDTMTMREIADGAGVHPRELRTVLLPEQQ